MKKNEQGLREMWNTINQTNMCIMGTLEGKEKKEQKKK